MVVVKEERLQILQMLKEGKITVDEANSLLEALGAGGSTERLSPDERGRFLRIRVAEKGTQRVNVSLPLELIKVAARWIPNDIWKDGTSPVDWEEVIRLVQQGVRGKLVEVTEADGTQVEVTVQ